MRPRTKILKAVARATILVTATSFAIAAGAHGTADATNRSQYPYTLIDLGTLGGPKTNFGNVPALPLTRDGGIVGTSDTPAADPYSPENPALSGDLFVEHTFLWQDGVMHDLGALGNLPGNNSSFASAVNEDGHVAGVSNNGTIDTLLGFGSEAHAVLWKDGRLIDLGTLGGGTESMATLLNNHDQVVGIAANKIPDPFSMFGFGTQTRAFLWEHGAMRDLGTLGGPDAFAVFVNDRGQIAGYAYTNSTPNPSTGFPTQDPFLWEHGKMLDLGTLGGTMGFAEWMNGRGEVVGHSNVAGDAATHAFLWRQGSLIDLGAPCGGSSSDAHFVNQAGAVVGDCSLAGNQSDHPFVWMNGVMTDLGVLGGVGCGSANAINDRNQIVGGSTAHCGQLGSACLWQHGSITNLNLLIAPSHLHLQYAYRITDQGIIVGEGILPNGDIHEYELVPNA